MKQVVGSVRYKDENKFALMTFSSDAMTKHNSYNEIWAVLIQIFLLKCKHVSCVINKLVSAERNRAVSSHLAHASSRNKGRTVRQLLFGTAGQKNQMIREGAVTPGERRQIKT